ncbi:chemotaxis protein CheW [Rhodoferax koreense]|uniref:Chemotaxis protein CheW n=1 Tax=Rhodoferax koreensis TaxID=1842727 RepID=A0A1P8JSQ6_9BURK|nr:chemotaxis protein CheW [Rhodoferax koreense]APW36792.1 chemotaxis protein CheW [Rhodoferax koreense]
MANREAIRELQARLAQRLQAARTEGRSVQWLAVEARGERYLFPLAQAGEIFGWPALQPTPYTHTWFLGVANLRGGLCGVVDLAAFLSGVPTPADADRADSSLLTFNHTLEINCALVIDRLAGLRGPEAFSAAMPPAPEAPAYFGPSRTDADGLAWREIDLLALSQSPVFLSINA